MCYDQLLRVGSRTLAYARETETYLLVFFFIRLADQLIIALNSVSCALKGFFFAHLLLNLLNTFAIVCYWCVTPEPGAL